MEKNLPKIIKNIKLYNLALSDKNDQVDLKIPIRNPKFNEKGKTPELKQFIIQG